MTTMSVPSSSSSSSSSSLLSKQPLFLSSYSISSSYSSSCLFFWLLFQMSILVTSSYSYPFPFPFNQQDNNNHNDNNNNNNLRQYTPHHRSLSFVDEDDEYPNGVLPNQIISETGLIVGFSVLAAGFCWTAIVCMRVTSSCREFYEWNAIRLILPTIQWAMALECLTLAYDSKDDTTIPNLWAIVTYMLQATIAPGIFLSTFVMTFLAYRTRSIPFCVIYRGPGRSVANSHGGISPNAAHEMDDDEEAMQPLVRPATMVVMVRLFTLGIFVLSLVVNFDVVWNVPDLAGRTGWKTVFSVTKTPSSSSNTEESRNNNYNYNNDDDDDVYNADEWNGSTAHVFLSLLPMALVSLSCLYFSLLLWRYGTFYSMVIYPSIINPWVSPIIGTGFLMTGQGFGPDLFPILSNAGILLYMMCFVRVMYEVRYDMRQAYDLGNFLTALGDDHITGSIPTNSVVKHQGSSSASNIHQETTSFHNASTMHFTNTTTTTTAANTTNNNNKNNTNNDTSRTTKSSNIGGGSGNRNKNNDPEDVPEIPNLPSMQ